MAYSYGTELAQRSDLGPFLDSLGLSRLGAEVGVYKGEFAEVILSSWSGELVLVDTWRHMPGYLDSWNVSDPEAAANLEETLARLARFGKRARFVRLESAEAAERMENESLDFVYIDANHAFEAVQRDLALWYPKIRKGGLFCGHDYFDVLADADLEPDFSTLDSNIPKWELTSYGVKSAVDAFALAHAYQVRVTDEEYPTWHFQKR